MSMYVEYDSNNSGGRWWLTDENWKALEAAGWRVEWTGLTPQRDDQYRPVLDDDGLPILIEQTEENTKFFRHKLGDRWLGALAKRAYRKADSLREAAEEWERLTGQSATDAGCPCCGQPHNFTLYRNGKFEASGPETHYEARWE